MSAHLRNAGVTDVLSLPLSRKILLEAMDPAWRRPRYFVTTPAYCGPDRRREQVYGYDGPWRRKTDGLMKKATDRQADLEMVAFLGGGYSVEIHGYSLPMRVR